MNLTDYSVGTDKGGEATFFDTFTPGNSPSSSPKSCRNLYFKFVSGAALFEFGRLRPSKELGCVTMEK